MAILARYASRYSVRALDLTVDSSMLWVGAGWLSLQPATGVCAACRRRGASRIQLSSGSLRVTGSANSRLRVFAVIQIAASFVLVARRRHHQDPMSLEAAQTGFDTHHVLAMNVPKIDYGGPAPGGGFLSRSDAAHRQLPA